MKVRAFSLLSLIICLLLTQNSHCVDFLESNEKTENFVENTSTAVEEQNPIKEEVINEKSDNIKEIANTNEEVSENKENTIVEEKKELVSENEKTEEIKETTNEQEKTEDFKEQEQITQGNSKEIQEPQPIENQNEKTTQSVSEESVVVSEGKKEQNTLPLNNNVDESDPLEQDVESGIYSFLSFVILVSLGYMIFLMYKQNKKYDFLNSDIDRDMHYELLADEI